MLLSLDVEEVGARPDSLSKASRPSWRRAFAFGLAAGVFAFAGLGTVIKVVFREYRNYSTLSSTPHPIDKTPDAFVPFRNLPRRSRGNGLQTSAPVKHGEDAAQLMSMATMPGGQDVDDSEDSTPKIGIRHRLWRWRQKLWRREAPESLESPRRSGGIFFPEFLKFWKRNGKLAKEVDSPGMRYAVKMIETTVGNDRRKYNEFCWGLPGAIPNHGIPGLPTGFFDPVGFVGGQDANNTVRRYREAELVHGRVSMLASLGYLTQEGFHPLFSADSGTAVDQFKNLPPYLWIGIFLGIGVCENVRIKKGWANPFAGFDPWTLEEHYEPGDLGFDPLGLKPTDPDELNKFKEKELWNGRLAMMAAAGFITQEALSGTTWSQQDIDFEELVKHALSARSS